MQPGARKGGKAQLHDLQVAAQRAKQPSREGEDRTKKDKRSRTNGQRKDRTEPTRTSTEVVLVALGFEKLPGDTPAIGTRYSIFGSYLALSIFCSLAFWRVLVGFLSSRESPSSLCARGVKVPIQEKNGRRRDGLQVR